ncbi:hypothetical protein [Legionella sp. WA2024007413]
MNYEENGKIFLILAIFAAYLALILSDFIPTTKILESSSMLLGITGLVQVKLTGFFNIFFKTLSEAAEAGICPSNIYRQIISNPETTCRTFIKELIYFNRKFGLGDRPTNFFMQNVSGTIWPEIISNSRVFLEQINFNDVLLHGMLAFLLFAAALHININQLAEQKIIIAVLALISTLVSTVIVVC